MDKNYISYAGERPMGHKMLGDILPPDLSFADALKITDCADGSVTARRVFGGLEDCCDINNKCSDISVIADEWVSRGKYVCTVKGGSKNITLAGVIAVHGREVDIDLGNRSDQSDNPTRNVTLNFTTLDGSKVTVRVLNAERPHLLNAASNYRFVLVLGPRWGSIWQKLFNQWVKVFGR